MSGRFDIAVLGAGMVGVSAAIHLRKAGLTVLLADRREPGEETSHGNAGIIQREGVHPYLFPRSPARLLQYAANRRVEANFHWSSIHEVAPFLLRYFLASSPSRARETLAANIPLFARCLEAHGELAQAAGAEHLISRNGWLAAFRSPASARSAERQLAELRDLGLDAQMLQAEAVAAIEPNLTTGVLEGVAHYRDPWTVCDPGALTKAYARHFEALGGVFARLDAMRTQRRDGGFDLGEGLMADQIVVALGPWSKPFLDRMGLVLPMGIKRGYHRHYAATGNALLTRAVVDDDNGFVLAPMARGIRLTSGAEFARLDAPATPVQLAKAEPLARQLFALGEPMEADAWLGARPVFPDMRAAIGPAPGLPGVWLDFGHAHHGLTLGPASGRMLAAMVTGGEPFCDPAPFLPQRFLR